MDVDQLIKEIEKGWDGPDSEHSMAQIISSKQATHSSPTEPTIHNMSLENTSINSILETLQEPNVNWQQVLEDTITQFDCQTGTLHFLDKDQLLQLQAQKGIPEFLMPKLSTIPIGKGMAGIAAERQKPVEMCNLQTDDSGVARPAAKETKVEGSIAVPMMLDGKLYGVFGIAKPVPYDFTEEEERDLVAIGEAMSKAILRRQ